MAALLETKSLSRRFGGLVAVDSIDMRIVAGDIHGLIGPNGAGKTTLLNLVSGHLASTSGTIAFDRKDITRLPAERRAAAGLRRTFQNLKLFREMTTLENVKIGLHAETRSEVFHALLRTRFQRREESEIEARARAALDLVGLLSAADQAASSLPYGYQRLLEIARAVVAKPKLLLLDEPAAGLNGSESRRLGGLIKMIRDTGITILLVEHHMDLVMPICDRITVLNYGSRLADGTPSEIRKHPEVIKAYLGKSSRQQRVGGQKPAEALRAAS
jgi:branched-chain amino acid transport system ATP-binding protein